jgi:hypothetical protein
MIELRKALHKHLKTIHTRVYFQQAPDNAQFPYLVYNMPSLNDDGEGHQLITLDIDGWDAPETGDTTALETLMASVNTGMNKKTIVTEDFAATFYLENKLSLTDDDPRIKRRKYVYQGRLFERG